MYPPTHNYIMRTHTYKNVISITLLLLDSTVKLFIDISRTLIAYWEDPRAHKTSLSVVGLLKFILAYPSSFYN